MKMGSLIIATLSYKSFLKLKMLRLLALNANTSQTLPLLSTHSLALLRFNLLFLACSSGGVACKLKAKRSGSNSRSKDMWEQNDNLDYKDTKMPFKHRLYWCHDEQMILNQTYLI